MIYLNMIFFKKNTNKNTYDYTCNYTRNMHTNIRVFITSYNNTIKYLQIEPIIS